MNNGREKVPWSQEIWNRIDRAVHAECQRTKIAAKFLPMYGPVDHNARTVPSDRVEVLEVAALRVAAGPIPLLEVDEAAETPVVEIQVQFQLTPQQVHDEQRLMTAVTLATRAANHLSQGEDLLIFQGEGALQGPLFTQNRVQLRSGTPGVGLLNLAAQDIQIVPVEPLPPRQPQDTQTRWGENAFAAVARAYSILQSGEGLAQAHYGPYALVFQHVPYADTYAPLATTLIMPADRIKPLVTEGFFGTGTLPPFRGFMASLGGNTMDLVMAREPTTAFLQEDPDGRFRFRVFERFTVREKDQTSVVRFEFGELQATQQPAA
jgi:uncharacterized linocin/CFP29 family protein